MSTITSTISSTTPAISSRPPAPLPTGHGRLPLVLAQQVFEFLYPVELAQVAKTCQAWRKNANTILQSFNHPRWERLCWPKRLFDALSQTPFVETSTKTTLPSAPPQIENTVLLKPHFRIQVTGDNAENLIIHVLDTLKNTENLHQAAIADVPNASKYITSYALSNTQFLIVFESHFTLWTLQGNVPTHALTIPCESLNPENLAERSNFQIKMAYKQEDFIFLAGSLPPTTIPLRASMNCFSIGYVNLQDDPYFKIHLLTNLRAQTFAIGKSSNHFMFECFENGRCSLQIYTIKEGQIQKAWERETNSTPDTIEPNITRLAWSMDEVAYTGSASIQVFDLNQGTLLVEVPLSKIPPVSSYRLDKGCLICQYVCFYKSLIFEIYPLYANGKILNEKQLSKPIKFLVSCKALELINWPVFFNICYEEMPSIQILYSFASDPKSRRILTFPFINPIPLPTPLVPRLTTSDVTPPTPAPPPSNTFTVDGMGTDLPPGMPTP
jgi:hypothetical protein